MPFWHFSLQSYFLMLHASDYIHASCAHIAKDAQVPTIMLASCNSLSHAKSRDIRMRLNDLQVVNRLVLSWLPKHVVHRLAKSYFDKLQQVCEWQVVTSLIFTDLLQLDEMDKFVEISWQVATRRQNWQLATMQYKSAGFLALFYTSGKF